MSIASPTVTIVPDTAPRRRGVRSIDEIEASSPTGRALHALEGVAYGGSQQALHYYQDRNARLSHDARADAHVDAVAVLAESLLLIELTADARAKVSAILLHVAGYRHADEHEDAAAESGDGRVAQMHNAFKRIAGWCEKSCVALRERARGLGR